MRRTGCLYVGLAAILATLPISLPASEIYRTAYEGVRAFQGKQLKHVDESIARTRNR